MLAEEDDSFEDDEDDYYQRKRAQIYRAPELNFVKDAEPTAAADVYAFAIILIEIATRNDPYGVSTNLPLMDLFSTVNLDYLLNSSWSISIQWVKVEIVR